MRRCAICGCTIKDDGNNGAYAFCPECRSDLSSIGCTDRHKLKPEPVPVPRCQWRDCKEISASGSDYCHEHRPPPTTEYHRAPGRYDWSMMIVAVACGSLGFIVGFLVRGAG